MQPPIDPFDGGPNDCQDLCEETDGCDYFTWRSYKTTPRRVCILKRRKGNQIAKATAISGSAYRCRAQGSYLTNYCWGKHDVTKLHMFVVLISNICFFRRVHC